MNLIDAYQRLKSFNLTVVKTADAADYLDVTSDYASKILARLAASNAIQKIKTGLWLVDTSIDVLELPELISQPSPSYISLYSALFYHGMIEQVSEVIYAASLLRTRRYDTKLGVVSLHYIQPDFFFGYECTDNPKIKMATPEKALIDTFYLSMNRSRLFSVLPELEIPRDFNNEQAHQIIEKIDSVMRRKKVLSMFEGYVV